MDPYSAEVVPEERLHEGARLRIERLARRMQYFGNNGRDRGIVLPVEF